MLRVCYSAVTGMPWTEFGFHQCTVRATPDFRERTYRKLVGGASHLHSTGVCCLGGGYGLLVLLCALREGTPDCF